MLCRGRQLLLSLLLTCPLEVAEMSGFEAMLAMVRDDGWLNTLQNYILPHLIRGLSRI